MTRRSLAGTVALALVAAVAGCATSGAHRLAERLPAELPDALTLAGWDRFAGQAQMGDAVVVYELYVNPIRPALYEITRYRLTSTARDRRQQTEKVLWNPATGSREPLRAFEWIHKRTWKTLWLGDPGEWRRIEPQTPAYESEMRNAIRVYQLHNERRTY